MTKLSDKKTGFLHSSDMKTPKGKVAYFMILSFLILTCLGTLIPIFWIIATAFKGNQEIYQSFSFFPKNLTLSMAFKRIVDDWNTVQLGKSMVNTVVYSIGALAFQIVFCGFGGFALSKLKPKGTTMILLFIVWSMMLPIQLRTVPLYISFMHFPFAGSGGINILDSYLPLWLMEAGAPFTVLLFKNHFDTISASLIEAARIDGCGEIQSFFKVIIPLSTPIIMYTSILSIAYSWSTFLMPYLVLNDANKMTVPIKIYLLKSDNSIKMNTYMMALLFGAIPPFLVFLIFNKHILGGVNVGGVKG